MERHNSVKHLELALDDSNLEEGITQLIKCARPEWTDLSLTKEQLSGGYINKIIAVYLENSPNDKVLVRIYGNKSGTFIDRKNELKVMVSFNKMGLIPPVYCSFNNGICYGYSPGIVLNKHVINDPNIYELIGETFARMHTVVIENEQGQNVKEFKPKPYISYIFRQLLEIVNDQYFDEIHYKPLRKFFKNRDRLELEIKQLEDCFKKFTSPVVFCHNDLQPKNIIFDSEKSFITFIDFEFSHYNFQSFDIGNHFNEFCGIESFNPNLYPNKELQILWIRHYLRTYKTLKGETIPDKSSFDKEVENLYTEVQYCAMTSHFFWALLIFIFCKDPQNQFIFYAKQRIEVYFDFKKTLFSQN